MILCKVYIRKYSYVASYNASWEPSMPILSKIPNKILTVNLNIQKGQFFKALP